MVSAINMWRRCWAWTKRNSGSIGKKSGVTAVYKMVDTCGAEFEAMTPYLYSTYEQECEAESDRSAESHDPRRRAEPDRAGD